MEKYIQDEVWIVKKEQNMYLLLCWKKNVRQPKLLVFAINNYEKIDEKSVIR